MTREVNSFLWTHRTLPWKGVQNGEERGSYYLYKDRETGVVSLIYRNTPSEDVGEGEDKMYVASTTIDLPLPRSTASSEKYDSVIMEPYDPSSLGDIRWGIYSHKELLKKDLPKDVYLALPLREIVEGFFTMRRYTDNAFNYVSMKRIQPSLWRDMTKAILWVQEQTWIHRDVKWDNFLVNEAVDHTGKKRIIAYLTDLDTIEGACAPPKKNRKPQLFRTWDACLCFADITTPFVGYYGLIHSRLILWTDNELLEKVRKEIYLQVTFNLTRKDPLEYYTGSKAYLNSEREREWNLFIFICVESSKLCRKLDRTEDWITEEMVEEAMKTTKAEEIKKELLSLADDLCKEVGT